MQFGITCKTPLVYMPDIILRPVSGVRSPGLGSGRGLQLRFLFTAVVFCFLGSCRVRDLKSTLLFATIIQLSCEHLFSPSSLSSSKQGGVVWGMGGGCGHSQRASKKSRVLSSSSLSFHFTVARIQEIALLPEGFSNIQP